MENVKGLEYKKILPAAHLWPHLDSWWHRDRLCLCEEFPDQCPEPSVKITSDVCGQGLNASQRIGIGYHDHCGHLLSKGVKFSTYTFIALPGIMLSFSVFQSMVGKLMRQCSGSEVPGWIANSTVLSLQMALFTGLIFVPLQWGSMEYLKSCYPVHKTIKPPLPSEAPTNVVGVRLAQSAARLNFEMAISLDVFLANNSLKQ